MRFVLEIQSWLEWEEEKIFDSIALGKVYAEERFSQNVWRIVDRFSSEVVFSYDPTIVLEEQANREIQRFAASERWIAQRFSDQRRTNTNIRGAAARLRRANDERRRRGGRRTDVRVNGDGWTPYSRRALVQQIKAKVKKITEKVNWLQEGF